MNLCISYSHKPSRVHFAHFPSPSSRPRGVDAVGLSFRRCFVSCAGDALKKRFSRFPDWFPNTHNFLFSRPRGVDAVCLSLRNDDHHHHDCDHDHDRDHEHEHDHDDNDDDDDDENRMYRKDEQWKKRMKICTSML